MINSVIPAVSVVVTTRNEQQNIKACLNSIFSQTARNIEVIVVDNFSTDNTEILAKGFNVKFFQAGPERCTQRNIGLCRLARGNYAMFIDADMILGPKVIQNCLDLSAEAGAEAIYIEEVVTGRSLLAKIRRFERLFYSGTSIDAVRFFNREIYCRIGGFDEELQAGGEDWDLNRRLTHECATALLKRGEQLSVDEYPDRVLMSIPPSLVTDSAIFHNDKISSITSYCRKKATYSDGIARYIAKWGVRDQIVRKQVGLRYRLVDVFFEDNKWRKTVRNPHLYALCIGLKIVIGVGFFLSRRAIVRDERNVPLTLDGEDTAGTL